MWTFLALSALLLLCWGPGHHLEFAERVLRRRRELLPGHVASLLHGNRAAYRYGNLAADIINMKAYGGHRNHCHRWTIVEEMRARAEGEAEEAFILGYLSHLAADTIAHNHFVPYHLARHATARGFGHLYWEMNADRFIAESRWEVVTTLKNNPELAAMDRLVNETVPRKALPMKANKALFNHVLLVAERQRWRRGMERLHPLRRVSIGKGFLARFQRAAVERVRLALHPRGLPKLAHLDTTGKLAQKEAMELRRKVLRETRPGAGRDEAARAAAERFLEGMQSPPPGHGEALPHWDDPARGR